MIWLCAVSLQTHTLRPPQTSFLEMDMSILIKRGNASFGHAEALLAASGLTLPVSSSAISKMTTDGQMTPLTRLTAGAGAGIIAMSATYPMDMVRGRLTVQEGTGLYNGIWHATRMIVKEVGGSKTLDLPYTAHMCSNALLVSIQARPVTRWARGGREQSATMRCSAPPETRSLGLRGNALCATSSDMSIVGFGPPNSQQHPEA